MKRKILAFIIIFQSFIINAQKLDLSYGPIMGLNASFMNSKSCIDYDFVGFHPLDKNFNFSTSNKSRIGYQGGVFVRLQPLNSRISLEPVILVKSYFNTYKLSLEWDAYYSTPSSGDNWLSDNITEIISNKFRILTLPIIGGYDLVHGSTYKLTFLIGISFNYYMNNQDHVKIDVNFEETNLYKDIFFGYLSGIRGDFNKLFYTLKFERSFNIQEATSRDYFQWEMKVDRLYLNSINLSIGYKFN